MSLYTHLSHKQKHPISDHTPSEPASSAPSLSALQAGAIPTREQMGRRVDLPAAIQAKMEASFGADLSGVQLYESQTVADAGADAVTMGNKIGFAPGRLDFVSSGGQELLGHELSHVVSQARGEVTGSGFLSDHTLEARADREGALAAAGERVSDAPVTPLSPSSALSAAGPMQARKAKGKKELLKDDFNPTSGIKGSGTDSTGDGMFFTSVFGSHEERTAQTVADSGMDDILGSNLDPTILIRAYNDSRSTKLARMRGKQELTPEEKQNESASQYFSKRKADGTMSMDVNFANEATQNPLKGNVYNPAPSMDNGKRVVLYSGSAGNNFYQMHDQVLQYLDAGYTVYAYDYGGFGDSKNKDGGATELSEKSMLQDSQAIYDHVAKLAQDVEGRDFAAQDTLIHGFSMGGAMASHVARNAAIKSAKSGKDEDKLGGLVLESSMRDTTNAAISQAGGFLGRLGGAIGSRMHGEFDTMANLKETAALDPSLPVTFLAGTKEQGDHLSESDTHLYEDSKKLFENTQHAEVNADHVLTGSILVLQDRTRFGRNVPQRPLCPSCTQRRYSHV